MVQALEKPKSSEDTVAVYYDRTWESFGHLETRFQELDMEACLRVLCRDLLDEIHKKHIYYLYLVLRYCKGGIIKK